MYKVDITITGKTLDSVFKKVRTTLSALITMAEQSEVKEDISIGGFGKEINARLSGSEDVEEDKEAEIIF